MLTALMILGSILLLLLLLLLAPIRLDAAAKDGRVSAQIRYLFLRFDLSPEALARRKEKKAAKAEKKPDKPPVKKEKEEEEPKPSPALDHVRELVRSSKKGVGILRRRLVLFRVEVYVCVGGPDAHQTALRYGRISSLVIAALDLLGILFVLQRPIVGILPDFTKTETRYELSLGAKIRPLFVLAAALSFLTAMIKSPAPPPTPRRKKAPQPVR